MSSDLADLFVDPPVGPSMDMRYRQGIILSFDQITLSNQVEVGGSIFVDLPLLGVGEATLLVAGSVVGVVSVVSSKGTATWAIMGRYVVPNTAEAADATALLSSSVKADTIAVQETCSTWGYSDLATVGPTVDVVVRATGRLLVFATAQIQWGDTASASANGGLAVPAFTGANTIVAGIAQLTMAPTAQFTLVPDAPLVGFQGTYTAVAVFDGLNPGLTHLTMKYTLYVPGKLVDFSRRTLVAITL